MAKTKGHLVLTNDKNDDVAIRVQGVSKSFKLPHNKQSSLKGVLINLVGRGDRTFETQEVLKDISFEIKKGEFFGIVGRNGSGKSTLLKLLAGIYTPSEGKIIVNGSLTPFIELGVGFNPELTGRENVYLNGALLGFNEKEVSAMYDDIVAFAELERFMDQKLKNYSSGMQVRLAFSIAIRAQSSILLLDEVLAVGDAAFQAKCYDYFIELKNQKKTVVLVTHDMSAVERFCTRALMINQGNIVLCGKPSTVATAYNDLNQSQIEQSIIESELDDSTQEDGQIDEQSIDFIDRSAKVSNIVITNESGKTTRSFEYRDMINVEFDIDIDKDISTGIIDVGLAQGKGGPLFVYTDTRFDAPKYEVAAKAGSRLHVSFSVQHLFQGGSYYGVMSLYDGETGEVYCRDRSFFKVSLRDIPIDGLTGVERKLTVTIEDIR